MLFIISNCYFNNLMEENGNEKINKESGQDKEKIDNNIEQKQKNDLRDIIEKKENNYFLNEEKKEKVVDNESTNNLNLIDDILNKDNDKNKEKELKKLKKQERKNKLLAKKHKSPEEIENERIFLENNKILINFLGDSITQGLKWQKKKYFVFIYKNG